MYHLGMQPKLTPNLLYYKFVIRDNGKGLTDTKNFLIKDIIAYISD